VEGGNARDPQRWKVHGRADLRGDPSSTAQPSVRHLPTCCDLPTFLLMSGMSEYGNRT
jgi:hypothetical protein